MNLTNLTNFKISKPLSNSSDKSGFPSLKVKKETGFNEKRTYILVFLTVLILSLTVFRQKVIDTMALINSNKEKTKKLEVLTSKANYLGALDQNQLDARVEELERVFPSKKPALETINSLNSLALEDGVFLSSFALNPGKLETEESSGTTQGTKTTAVKSTIQSFDLNFSASGEAEKMVKFIKDLQQTAPLNKVNDLALFVKKDNATTLSVQLTIEVYYQPLPKSLASLEAPVVHLNAAEEKVLNELSVYKYFPLSSLAEVSTGRADIFKKSL